MIEFEALKSKPYESFSEEITCDKYIVKVTALYKTTLYEYEIKCRLIEEKLWGGTVDVHIDEKKFLSDEKKISFKDLQVSENMQNRGIGSMLMKKVFEIARQYISFVHEDEAVFMSGGLSNSDYQNGNWSKSLPFYQKVANENNVRVIFKGKDSGKEYSEAIDYFEYEANKDGMVIYRL